MPGNTLFARQIDQKVVAMYSILVEIPKIAGLLSR